MTLGGAAAFSGAVATTLEGFSRAGPHRPEGQAAAADHQADRLRDGVPGRDRAHGHRPGADQAVLRGRDHRQDHRPAHGPAQPGGRGPADGRADPPAAGPDRVAAASSAAALGWPGGPWGS